MLELSETAQAALILHDASKLVSGRCDGSWWIIDARKWECIKALPAGPEHSFILALISAEARRKLGE
jgi:hypothetical protein